MSFIFGKLMFPFFWYFSLILDLLGCHIAGVEGSEVLSWDFCHFHQFFCLLKYLSFKMWASPYVWRFLLILLRWYGFLLWSCRFVHLKVGFAECELRLYFLGTWRSRQRTRKPEMQALDLHDY